MRFNGETREQYIDRVSRWHTVFAWLPTQCESGQIIWLEKIQRRIDICDTWAGSSYKYFYKPID